MQKIYWKNRRGYFIRVGIVSTSPERDDTIIRGRNTWEWNYIIHHMSQEELQET